MFNQRHYGIGVQLEKQCINVVSYDHGRESNWHRQQNKYYEVYDENDSPRKFVPLGCVQKIGRCRIAELFS